MSDSIKRQDIIDDDALKAPIILTENFQNLLVVIQKIVDLGPGFAKAFGNADTTTKLKKPIDELTQSEIELNKIQSQIATAVAKNNEQYTAQTVALTKAREQLKLNVATSDQAYQLATRQNSSLIQLEKALNANRLAYASLRTEQDRQTESGKKLLALTQEQDKGVKALRASLGQFNGNVGNYPVFDKLKEGLPELKDKLKEIAPALVGAGDAAVSIGSKFAQFFTNPITIGLGAVLAVLGTLKEAAAAYFENTVEGTEKSKTAFSAYTALIEVGKEAFIDLGRATSKALGIGDENGNGGFFNNVLKGVLSTSPALAGVLGLVESKQEQINEQIKLENEIRREEIKLSQENAGLQLERDKAMFEARDKVRNSDEERYQQLQKSRELGKEIRKNNTDALEEQIKLQRQVIAVNGYRLAKEETGLDLLKQDTEFRKVNFENIEKLVNLENKRLEIQDKAYQGARRRQALENSILQDIEARQVAVEKQVEDAKTNFAETSLTRTIDINKRIVNNQKFSLDEQLDAQEKQSEAEGNLAQLAAQKEIEAARVAALEKIEINSKVVRAIQDDESIGTAGEKVALIRAQKNKELSVNKEFQDLLVALNEKGVQKDNDIQRDGLKKRLEITKAYYEAEIGIINSESSEATAERQLAIYADYGNQVKTIIKFEAEKAEIIRESERTRLRNTIAVLQEEQEKVKALGGNNAATLAELGAKISNAQLTLVKITTDREIELLKERNVLAKQFQQEFLNSFKSIGDELYSDQEKRISDRLSALQDSQSKELEIAGDNEAAKFAITQQFALKTAEEEKKLKKAQHDQAVFDRDLAIVQIAIQTAEAIARVLPLLSNPFTAAIGAEDIALISGIGAVQAAAVIAKPIPAYAKGTKNSKGGLAIVGEEGPELMIDGKTGQAHLFDVPGASLTYLNEGSQIFTAEETARLKAKEYNQQVSPLAVSISGRIVNSNQSLERKIDELIHVTKTKKTFSINITKGGLAKMVEEAGSFKKIVDKFYTN